jgi:cell division transport system permease protein
VHSVPGVDQAAAAGNALALAQAAPGVSAARLLSVAETQALLEPWLGPSFDLSLLPLPRIIVVSVAGGKRQT